MGCDVHILAEKKVDGIWVPFEGSYEIDIDEYNGEKNEYVNIGPYNSPFYFGRDYDSFAIMADVRNGYGFAGVDTGDGFKPISEPRGVPVDASEIFQRVCKAWDGDGHSHSYLYLKELKEWRTEAENLKTTHRGVITIEQFKKRLEDNYHGRPRTSWAGGVSGGGVVTLNPQRAKELIESNDYKNDDVEYYVQIDWEETYLDSAVGLVRYIELLEELEIKENLCHNCIRICFFFDN